MDNGQATVSTTLADLHRVGPFLLEIRFKPNVTVDALGMKQVHEARWRIFQGAPHVVISIIPDGVETDVALVSSDVHAVRRPSDGLRAAALVAKGSIAEMVAKLYYAYYPPHFRLKVTTDEETARAWVMDEVRAIEAEGSRSAG